MTLEKIVNATDFGSDRLIREHIDVVVNKINEIIEYINGVEAAFGIEIGTEVKTGTECCKEDGN